MGVVVLLHVAVVLWVESRLPPGASLFAWGGLRRGAALLEPWRLVTSLFLHADLRHALGNGVSMLVFAVPVLTWVGYARAALIYLASGVGGGITALAFTGYGTTIIGSSGAISGLFGAWVVFTLHRARTADLPRRARVRATGIALLVLPSLLNPITATGQSVSVSSHLGGAATGMLIGALLSRVWLEPDAEAEG